MQSLLSKKFLRREKYSVKLTTDGSEFFQAAQEILSREAMLEKYPKIFGEALKNFHVVATYNLIFNAAILAHDKFLTPQAKILLEEMRRTI